MKVQGGLVGLQHRQEAVEIFVDLVVPKDLFGGTSMRTLPEHAPYLTGLIGIKLLSSNIL